VFASHFADAFTGDHGHHSEAQGRVVYCIDAFLLTCQQIFPRVVQGPEDAGQAAKRNFKLAEHVSKLDGTDPVNAVDALQAGLWWGLLAHVAQLLRCAAPEALGATGSSTSVLHGRPLWLAKFDTAEHVAKVLKVLELLHAARNLAVRLDHVGRHPSPQAIQELIQQRVRQLAELKHKGDSCIWPGGWNEKSNSEMAEQRKACEAARKAAVERAAREERQRARQVCLL